MNSWIYLFSKFTAEALLFEALAIFLLCCGYTAFWILRKRRYGIIDSSIPAGPVKTYLNELIANAEAIRLQLFGLLAGKDPNNPNLYKVVMPSASGPDPATLQRLAAAEAKAAELQTSVDVLNGEKEMLEQQLQAAKSAPAPEAKAAAPEDAGQIVKLQKHVDELEGKLAEYSVIEDDLANLKRLQQENAALKAQLEGGGGGGAAAPAPAAAAEAAPAEFEAAPEPAGAEAAAPQATESGDDGKNEDLVAEFERMLKE